MEKKIKTGSATIDINEYDRLMTIEREFDAKLYESKSESNNNIKLLMSFFMCLEEMEKEIGNSFNILNEVFNRMDASLEIERFNSPSLVLGKGKQKYKLRTNA